MTDPLPWLVVLPLAWASVAFLLGPGRGAVLAAFGVALQCALAFELAARVQAAGALRYAVGGWGSPLGIDWYVDGLAVLMLGLTQVVALPLLLYARSYFGHAGAAGRYFWPLAGFLIGGMNALFVSADLFNLYVTLEIVGLAAVGLVAAGGGAAQLAAALRYLFATLLGSGAFLLGVALIYGACGTVSIELLGPLLAGEVPRVVYVAVVLMSVGLFLKTALFPFHYWLPPAHGGAAAPVSALLSALVIKASFYLLLRLWLGIYAPLVQPLGWLPAALGSVAILWGSWQAVRAEHLKLLVAWSTVAQIGYLFLAFPLLATQAAALDAVVFQAVSHALAKAAMFAATGVVIHVTGNDTVAGVAGIAQRLPLTLFAFALAGVTLMGLPPSGGFLAKWLLIDAALAEGAWPLVLVVLLGGLLAAWYVFRVLRQAFLLVPPTEVAIRAPRMMEWSALLLAAASVALGVRGIELARLIAPVGAS